MILLARLRRTDLATVLLRLLAVAAAITAVADLIHHPTSSWVEIYFVVLAVALAAVSLLPAPERAPAARPAAGWQWAVFLVVLAWRLSRASHMTIWLDESFQVATSGAFPAVFAGSRQHQPPLGLAITDFVQHLAPYSVLAMRVPPILWSALSALLLFRLLFALVEDQATALALTALYAAHGYVELFGVEERPISLGLFSFLLTLERMFPALCAPGSEAPPFAQTACAASLCVLGLGLQPPFAFVALGMALVPVAFARARVGWLLRTVAPLVAALVLYAPIQWYTLTHAPPRFGKLSHAAAADLWTTLTSPATFEVASTYYLRPLVSSLLAGLLAVTIQLAVTSRLRRLLNLSFWVLAPAAFMVPISLLFTVGMDWPLAHHYLILGWPLLLLLLARLLATIELPRRLGRSALVPVLVVLCALASRGFATPPWDRTMYERGTSDFQSLYRAIAAGPRPTIVHPLCVDDTLAYCPEELIGVNFYLKDAGAVEYSGKSSPDERAWPWLRRWYFTGPPPERVTLVATHEWPGDPPPPLGAQAGVTFHEFHRLSLIVVDGPDARRRTLQLLETYRQAYFGMRGHEPWALYPTLIWGYLGEGETERARQLFRAFHPFPNTYADSLRPMLAADVGAAP